LHICPGRRVTPKLPRAGDKSFDRLLILVHRFKVAKRQSVDLDEATSEELGELLELHEDRYPPERLSNWSERQENRTAIETLARAADIVTRAFDQFMSADFLAAMREQFLRQDPESETPCTCFVWFRNAYMWKGRLETLGGKPTVDGMTPFWGEAVAVARPARLGGTHAPVNRSIEFHEPKLDTLVHEMIHWCTSMPWHEASLPLEGNVSTLVREGSTEWLKRHATNDWMTGGYVDVMPRFRAVMDSGVLTRERLTAAYFGGKDCAAVIRTIIDTDARLVQESTRAYMDGQHARERTAILALFQGRTLTVDRGADFRTRVFTAFGPLPDAEVRTSGLNAQWQRYVLARKAGSDDAAALAAAKQP